tara:strand:- start:1055 stop:1510 length:456 start_codon:yes stop_codon:yes gene_type:complete
MLERQGFSDVFRAVFMPMLRLLFLVTLLIHPMSGMMAQQIMHSVGNHRIEIEGEKMRPGRALSISGSGCPMASDHFAKAKKMRSWNFLTSQFGFAEVLVGLLAIDQGRVSFGIANAAVGGLAMAFFSDRDDRIQKEIDEGVQAYNRCQILN